MQASHNFYYLLKIQFLGFRYHGWQKQIAQKTVQLQVEKTVQFIFPEKKVKTLASGRTDAMVSAEELWVELFINQEFDCNDFINSMNKNLPQDIKCIDVIKVDRDFQVMRPRAKTYHYYFSHGEKIHPFCAPIMTGFLEDLNIDLMQKGAKLFVGTHEFRSYCYRSKESLEKVYTRNISVSEILTTSKFQANFFPKNLLVYEVSASGFLRHQVRMMMGALYLLGRGDITLEEIEKSLETGEASFQKIAPASGLILHKVHN